MTPRTTRTTRTSPALWGQPLGEEGPVFREPWEAQAFALTLTLHERGLFTWPEWAEALGAQLAAADPAAQATGACDDGTDYYRHWLAALEALLARLMPEASPRLEALRHGWAHAAARTPHGEPIELQPSDLPATDHHRG